MTKYYLGVHEYGEGHDAGVCLVDETGAIITVLEAERFTKIKKLNPVIPDMLFKELFTIVDPEQIAGLGIGQISHVYDSYRNKVDGKSDEQDMQTLDVKKSRALSNFARVYRIADYLPNVQKVVEVRHHLAHIYSAYYPSPFDEALVISVDGNGDFPEAVVIGYGRGEKCSTLWSAGDMTSLGALYRNAGMKYIGLISPEGEGKIMGLASYGKPVYADQLLEHIVHFDPDRMTLDFHAPFGIVEKDREIVEHLETVFGPAGYWENYDPLRELPQNYKDMAASVQKVVTDYLLFLVRKWTEKTGCRNLCLAGGVAMNSMANGEILRSGLVDNMFVQPASSDNGLCLGAAYALLKSEHPQWRNRSDRFVLRHTYFGSQSTNQEIEHSLDHFGLTFQKVSDPAAFAAKQLSEGKIVGWFQGKMEFGARALGNRSILADPRKPEMKDAVNIKVKNREIWRPFAPAILCERIGEWFDCGRPEPFMTVVYKAREECRDRIPAVLHIDGTARIQSVDKLDNPKFYRVIQQFEKITGVPIVMNTSLNGKGEPIVRVPAEAIKLFLTTQMDVLVLEDYAVVSKPDIAIQPYDFQLRCRLFEINHGQPFHAAYIETTRRFTDEKMTLIKTAVVGEKGCPLTGEMPSGQVKRIILFLLGNYDDEGVGDGLVAQTIAHLHKTYPEADIQLIELFEDSINLRGIGMEAFWWPLKISDTLPDIKFFKDSLKVDGFDFCFKKVDDYTVGNPLILWPAGGTTRLLLDGNKSCGLGNLRPAISFIVDKYKRSDKSYNGLEILSPLVFRQELAKRNENFDLFITTEAYLKEIIMQVISFRDQINIYLMTRELNLFKLV